MPRHPCAFGPRSIGARVRLPVSFFAGTEEDATKKETQRIRRRHETAFFSFSIFFSASSSLGAGIDRNSSEIRHTNDRGCLSKRRIPKHPPREYTRRRKVVVVRKKEDEEKKQRAKTTLTHRLETSLFGAVTRTDWAAAVWVKENILVTCVRVLKCVD